MQYYALHFAQAYGEGAYGSSTYSCTQAQINAGTCVAGGTAGGGSSSGGGTGAGGGLADTGFSVVLIVTLACLIMFIGLVVRIWRKPKPALQVQETYTPDTPVDTQSSQDS